MVALSETETDPDGGSGEGAVVVAVGCQGTEAGLRLDHRVAVGVGEGVHRGPDEEGLREVVVHSDSHSTADVEGLSCGLAHPCLVVLEGDVLTVGVSGLDSHVGQQSLHSGAEVAVEAQGDVELHGVAVDHGVVVGDVARFPVVSDDETRHGGIPRCIGEAESAAWDTPVYW